MTFEQRLSAAARKIDGALAAHLDAHDDATDGSAPPRLLAAMRHAVMSGGKRIRPFLVIETAAMFGVERQSALSAAIALELVHCYSLVHDDLPAMDNDEMRRGRQTVWKQYDDWTAILAGDALLTLAFEVLTTVDGMPHLPATTVTLIRELARASGKSGMVGGQCMDLQADKLGDPARPTLEHIARLQALKTGALFRFACHAGCVLGNASSAETAAVKRFGDKLGAAFQLADDLLDAEGEAAVVGKATGKDTAAGKATLIGLTGIVKARARLLEIEALALEELNAFGPRAEILREALRFAVRRQN